MVLKDRGLHEMMAQLLQNKFHIKLYLSTWYAETRDTGSVAYFSLDFWNGQRSSNVECWKINVHNSLRTMRLLSWSRMFLFRFFGVKFAKCKRNFQHLHREIDIAAPIHQSPTCF